MESTITEDNRQTVFDKIISMTTERFSDINAHYHEAVNVFVVERWTDDGEEHVHQTWVFDFGRDVAHLVSNTLGVMEYDFYEDCYKAFNVLAIDMEVM